MARRATRPGGRRPRKVERKYSLSAEAALRLDVHALASGRRPGELIDDLVLAHLRRYHLTDRGAGQLGDDQVEPLGPVLGPGGGGETAGTAA